MRKSSLAGIVGALVIACALLAAPGAQAIPWCGNSLPNGKVFVGSVQLKTEESTTSLDFGSSSDSKDLVLIFELGENCSIFEGNGIVARPHASGNLEEAFGKPEIEAYSGLLIVEIPVDGSKVDPGKHSAAIAIRSLTPLIDGTIVKVSIQRKEEPLIPALIAIICTLIGIGAAILVTLENAGKGARFRFVGIATAVVAAFIAAGAVWRSAYVEPEVWKAELETILTLVVGALPAAFGAAVASLKTVVKSKEPSRSRSRAASPDPVGPGEVGAATDR